jgi:N-acetylglucosamine kinase
MIACFDIGGSAIKYARADAAGQLTTPRRLPTPTDDFTAFAGTMHMLMASPADAHAAPPRAIAIAMAGVIDPADGRIQSANIASINGRALAADLSARFGLPVLIANDADCFAVAEARAGAGRGHTNVFGLILGTGVGGGLVIDKRLVTGPGGFAGEWGHGPVAAQYAGTPPAAIPRFACGCGQIGCLDTVGGARGLERLHLTLHGSVIDSKAIVDGWQDGQAEAARTIDCWADLLCGPLAMLVNTLGASILPVGGGLANSAPLIALLDRRVRAAILRKTDRPLIVQGQAGIEPGLTGAAWLGLAALDGAPSQGVIDG